VGQEQTTSCMYSYNPGSFSRLAELYCTAQDTKVLNTRPDGCMQQAPARDRSRQPAAYSFIAG
jgi:hypothetical protein